MGEAFDRQEVLDRFGGDVGLLRQIADLFRDSAGPWLAEIHAAQTAGDLTLVRRVAHTLKGSVGNFLARNTAAAALLVEQRAAAGDIEHLSEAIAGLEGELTHLLKCLDDFLAACERTRPPS